MGKFLKVLAFIFLVLSVLALVLGTMLFGRRELLKGRTQKLETAVIQLGSLIESQAVEPQPNTFPAKDASECAAEALDSPEKSEFWKTYAAHLELQNQATISLGDRKAELASYYLRDPVTLKVMRDESGFKVVKGKGTMQDLLDEVQTKAEEQLKRLNETRQQLKTLREELVKTIEELNTRKGALRTTLKGKADVEKKNGELEETVKQKEQQVAEVTDQKRQAEEQLAVQKQNVARLEEEIADNKEQIASLKKTLAARTGEGTLVSPLKVGPGVKGKVMAANEQWGFAILDMDEAFLKELLGDDLTGDLRIIELNVKRPGPDGGFVTKVRLYQVKRDQKLGIADVLADWQQQPIQAGDVVYY